MFVKPARPEVKVRDPKTMRHIPESGLEVPEDTFWLRRLRDGDVVEVPQMVTAPTPPTKSKGKE